MTGMSSVAGLSLTREITKQRYTPVGDLDKWRAVGRQDSVDWVYRCIFSHLLLGQRKIRAWNYCLQLACPYVLDGQPTDPYVEENGVFETVAGYKADRSFSGEEESKTTHVLPQLDRNAEDSGVSDPEEGQAHRNAGNANTNGHQVPTAPDTGFLMCLRVMWKIPVAPTSRRAGPKMGRRSRAA